MKGFKLTVLFCSVACTRHHLYCLRVRVVFIDGILRNITQRLGGLLSLHSPRTGTVSRALAIRPKLCRRLSRQTRTFGANPHSMAPKEYLISHGGKGFDIQTADGFFFVGGYDMLGGHSVIVRHMSSFRHTRFRGVMSATRLSRSVPRRLTRHAWSWRPITATRCPGPSVRCRFPIINVAF